MPKPEIDFQLQEARDLTEHRNYSRQVLKDLIDAFDAANHLPPRCWGSWPTAAEIGKQAMQAPDPMIAINAMRARQNPDPFRMLRRSLRTPRLR